MIDFKALMERQSVRYVLCLVIGITVGALFYPTKKIEEKVSEKYEKQISELRQTSATEKASLQERLDQVKSEFSSYQKETNIKLTKNTEEITSLKKKQKTSYYKIVKPDGTVEIRRFSESEVDESSKVIKQIQEEFTTKLSAVEQKWEQKHKDRVEQLEKTYKEKQASYEKTIQELEKTKVVSINEKKFSLDVGLLTNKDYYGHATMDLWGPLIIGVHGQLGTNNAFGGGLGIRF